ncbi:MAG TPA: hypothetical protein VGO00_12250 [Kofleriaceae bacterium]|jgi:hypothetical protein|nr:hypothetical protein [Kofleriaceae bacterium]
MTRIWLGAVLLAGCIPASLLSSGTQGAANRCVADFNTMLAVPADPSARFAGRWSCVFQSGEGNVTEYIDVDQAGSDITVSMHDLRGNSNIGRGHSGGDVLAYQYTAGHSGVRLEGGGRVIQGYVRFYSADDCSPHPYSCVRR